VKGNHHASRAPSVGSQVLLVQDPAHHSKPKCEDAGYHQETAKGRMRRPIGSAHSEAHLCLPTQFARERCGIGTRTRTQVCGDDSNGLDLNKKALIGCALALPGALGSAYALLFLANMLLQTPQGPYAALAGAGLLAGAAILGILWSDRKPVRILRRSLVVLALLALLAGTGVLAVGWLVWRNTGHLYGPGGWVGAYTTARTFGLLLIWPTTGFVVWLLGAMALLARRRFGVAAVYTMFALVTSVAIPAIVVYLPAFVRSFPRVGLVTAPGWIGALFFLAFDAAAVYIAWTKLFGTDFVQPAMRGTK
jgi:hypothetical protein